MNSVSKSIEVINKIIDRRKYADEDDKYFWEECRSKYIKYANKGVDFSRAVTTKDLSKIWKDALLKEISG